MRTTYKKLICLAFVLPLLVGQAFAWGQTGHRVVGQVAEQHLKKKVRKKVMQILQDNSLAEVSTWMDDIKSDSAYNHTHDWHWVTIPDNTTYEQTTKNPKGDLVMKLEDVIAALKAKNLTKEKEQEYLKYLVHLVGDLHQPMHVGGKDDNGGNSVRLQWFGQNSNLHRVWDSDMIDNKDLSFTELAYFVGEPTQQEMTSWQAGTIKDWAYGMMVYRPQVYNLPPDLKLSYKYSYQNFKTIEKCLLQAGIRLAGVLNEIYG
ncbi:S1/P1 Nuclease [Nibribacter ruber]|uniref:S1/P1 Nuclease n=1 Tax=Nibribacter ruber TaxID=2698458 RepID=A0A6P1NZK2_9BACT|nr:S1/P1 nuclease [Nibribacter ruber]QHL86383.1 S1/P1 Nuclease [Nibribacter ruber]